MFRLKQTNLVNKTYQQVTDQWLWENDFLHRVMPVDPLVY